MTHDKPDIERLILVRIGEITLKGLNRGRFVAQLIANMRWRLRDIGVFDIEQRHSRIWVRSLENGLLSDETIMNEVVNRLSHIFGIVSISPAVELDADYELLKTVMIDYATPILKDAGPKTFKIDAKRIDKEFPVKSYDLCCETGALFLDAWPDQLSVQVKNPDFTFYVEVRDTIFLYHDIINGVKGLPVGMGGKGMLLLSGGIDSPVAGYMMASRGMTLDAVYFHTFPYTSPQALIKVQSLASSLSLYAGRIRLHVVDFTETQLELNRHCPDYMLTIVMRRMMMRIACRLAEKTGTKALITGESLGQVASQTVESLIAIDAVSSQPVFRPLIGMDKNQTITIARDIGTFETSILPYDDCCSVFLSKHPQTHPTLEEASWAEERLDIDRLVAITMLKITEQEIQPAPYITLW